MATIALRVVFALAALLAAGQAMACSCVRATPAERLAGVDDIALVTVLGVQRVDGDDVRAPQRATYAVERTLKGDMTAHATLDAGYGFGDCGVPLVVDMSYVVLLDRASNVVNYCSGFFGPFSLHRSRSEVSRFLDGLAQHAASGAPLTQPPRTVWGIEDARLLWFGFPGRD
ncbi:MAG TPA: hypothetical protein VLF18_17535 [Tahibacter sp.]|uniref:hypothetical protein n=1 Tax=Tahibacter sp. TaxID=2056211 RepID=UPI002C03D16F|nr:hypothetical protein [Tahibacter sp.]HSX61993.1 hypothetical protein [Tahibacter sp.]